MYNIAVHFDVKPEHRNDFIAAALEDGRNSEANEPGTRRFELIADEVDPNRFYLNEAYDDVKAFDVHAKGPHFALFFKKIQSYVKGPTFLVKGNRVDETSGTTNAAESTRRRLGITHSDHVALRVADYDASVRFYTEVLGLDKEKEWTLPALPGLRFAYLRLGAFKVEIIGGGTPNLPAPTVDVPDHLSRGGYIHLCLHVRDLEAILVELKKREVPILAEPFVVEPIGKRLAMFKDNSGNVIELAQDL